MKGKSVAFPTRALARGLQRLRDLPSAYRRLFQILAGSLSLACSGDDLTGPSVADRLDGRGIAASAVNGLIAFDSQRDGNSEVYVMNPDGTDETNLTNNGALDGFSDWSLDGTRIAFSSNRENFDLEIFVMNADGTGPVNLTHSPNTDLAPTWSPDGTKIAFYTFRDAGSGLQSEIYVMDADGTDQTRLTNHPDIDVHPEWSPDGTKIAFVRQAPFSSDAEIYVMDAATGGNQTNLTNNPASDGSIAWSPDGSKIAFGSSRDGATFGDVWVMDSDGGNPVRLTNHPAGNGEPSWSPDGTKIAFTTGRDGGLQIYVMNADGSDQVPLTAGPGSNSVPDWGVAPGTSTTCAEGVSEARSRISQLFAGRPILRFVLNLLLSRMQSGTFPNAETNFGLLLDFATQQGIITPQDAAGLKDLVAPC